MKKIYPLLALSFIITVPLQAQRLSDIDTGKYSIELPGYWKPGNKVWSILTDKLPTVCEELVDKELCGDHCNPKYKIKFAVSEPEIVDTYPNHISTSNNTETWGFVTSYRFFAALLLYNEKDKLLSKLILVDTDETWRVTRKAELPSYRSSMLPRANNGVVSTLVTNSRAAAEEQIRQYALRPGIVGQTPHDYINKNADKLRPTDWDLLLIVDKKIRSWE